MTLESRGIQRLVAVATGIPLVPELRPFLEKCFDMAKPGAKYVITRYRRSNANLRTQLERIIKRAGLEQWPKLFPVLTSVVTGAWEIKLTAPNEHQIHYGVVSPTIAAISAASFFAA